MLQLKTKPQLAKEAFTLAKSYKLVRYRSTTYIPADFETGETDELLIRGLGHSDWIVGNVPNLRRMFRGNAINFSLPPRLFLLAPEFSSRVRCAARQVVSPEIEWIRYQLLEMAGGTGIFFERLPGASDLP